VPSGGLVTTVSGGSVAGAVAQDTRKRVNRNVQIKVFISTPVGGYGEDVLCLYIVPQNKKTG
jgi:hypothetical protein